jgi:hypothetical protein
VFLWPEFHESSEFKYTFVSGETWGHQLKVACEIADGVVIWGGWDLQKKRAREWDDHASWWKVTLELQGIRP